MSTVQTRVHPVPSTCQMRRTRWGWNGSVIFKLEFESRMDPSSDTLLTFHLHTYLELSDFYTSLSNVFVTKIKFLNFFTIAVLHILLIDIFISH